jgi:hypothetical protein
MRDINGIHVGVPCNKARDKANKTRLSRLPYLTDLTAHMGDPGLWFSREPGRSHRLLRHSIEAVDMNGMSAQSPVTMYGIVDDGFN